MFVHVQWSLFLVHHGRGRWMHDQRISMARPPGATLRIEYFKKKNVMTVGLWKCQLPAWNPLPWSRVASTLRSSPQQNCWKRTNIAVTWHMGKSFNSSATSSRAPWPSRGAPPSEQIDKLKQKMKVEKSSGPNHLHTFSHCCKKNTQICCLCQPDGTTRVPTNAGLDLYETRSH